MTEYRPWVAAIRSIPYAPDGSCLNAPACHQPKLSPYGYCRTCLEINGVKNV